LEDMPLQFHHRDPGLVGLLTDLRLLKQKQVFYGIIADGNHTHETVLRIAYKSNPTGLFVCTPIGVYPWPQAFPYFNCDLGGSCVHR
jgi:N-acetylglucosamine-6-phosphate deacetylase